MQPTLKAGDMVLVAHFFYAQKKPQIGDIVLAKHPYQSLYIIKRVAELSDEHHIILHSDNTAAGTDSRQWGALPLTHIFGKVTCRLEPHQKSLS